MSSLALIAETPRAGEYGHRFLVAANAQSSEALITKFLAAVDKDTSLGANFIGVGHSVKQVSGTAVRTGREIIVLAGVDVSRLSEPSRDRLLALLHEQLDRLEDLVLGGIDWSRLARADLVTRSGVLNQWLDEIRSLQLPETEWQSGPRSTASVKASPTSKRRPRVPKAVLRRLMPLLVVAILIVVFTLLRDTSRSGGGQSSAYQDSESSHGVKTIDDYKNENGNLAEEWGCSEVAVVRSLLRAANWDRRREAATMSLDTGLDDGEVRQLLDQMSSKNDVERLFISKAIESEPEFRRFALSHVKNLSTSHQMRRWLFDAWGKWKRLQTAAKKSEQPLSVAKNVDDWAQMMLDVAKVQPDVGAGDDFRAPVTPLYDRQDVMIWRVLNDCRVRMEDHGVSQYLSKPVDSPPDSELASFFAAVRTNRGTILGQLAESRSLAAETVGKLQGQEEEKSVTSAFRAFEHFIEHLARFDE